LHCYYLQGKQELDEVLAQNATLQEKLGSLELLVSENQEEIRRLRETKHVPEVQQQQRSEQAPKEEARASAAAAPFQESRARALYPRKAESQDEMSFEVNDEGRSTRAIMLLSHQQAKVLWTSGNLFDPQNMQ
jgi:hypothetical protein